MYEVTVEELAYLLRQAEAAHADYEKTLGRKDDDWPTYYARYVLNAMRAEFRRMCFSVGDGRAKSGRSDVKTEKCPKCGRAHIRRIAYGFPGPKMGEAAERGEIALGGCVIDERSRQWECAHCNVTFNDGRADD